MSPPRFDRISYWSEIKLDIIKEYARAYSTILSGQKRPSFKYVYIDGFSGAGVHVAKRSGELVPGSALNALNVVPPFHEYFLIDLDGDKVAALREQIGDRPDVHLEEGDCNSILVQHVFPQVRYKDYRRGLCLLDPYGLHLCWEVIRAAGQLRTIDLFLNFPIMDMNRNALWRHPEKVPPDGLARMTALWGDDSWRQILRRSPELTHFRSAELTQPSFRMASAIRERG